MNKFYVYRHIRLDKNIPFYVGKGCNDRAFVKDGRNDFWTKIVKSSNYKIEIILNNLTEQEAFNEEKRIIAIYKKYGLCEANFSDGGEGNSGYSHTVETKNKIAKTMSGKYKNKKHSQKSKENMSKGSIGQKTKKNIFSKRAKENISIAHGGRRFDVFKCECIKKPTNKNFGEYIKKEYVGSFLNQKEAAIILKISQPLISKCLNKKIPQASGYIIEEKKDV